MRTDILTLCEYASDHDGSLSILDTFDIIKASKFPWRAYFYLAARISNNDSVEDFKEISIKIYRSDNPEEIVFVTSSPCENVKDFKNLNLVTGFKGLIFNSPGFYILNICLDQKSVAELKFNVELKQ